MSYFFQKLVRSFSVFGPTKLFFTVFFCAVSSLAPAKVYTINVGNMVSLHEAISLSNASEEADVIVFEPGVFPLNQFFGSDRVPISLPELKGQLVIRAHGAELSSSRRLPGAMLRIAKGAEVHIFGLTLGAGGDGAVRNAGRLILTDVRIQDQNVWNSDAVVENSGYLTLKNTEIGYNVVDNAGKNAGIVLNYGTLECVGGSFRANKISRRWRNSAVASTLLNYGDASLQQVVMWDNEVQNGLEPDEANAAPSGLVVNIGRGQVHLDQVFEQRNFPALSLQ